MISLPGIADTVSLGRVNLEIKWYPRSLQGKRKHRRVLHMNVVVHRAVDQQQAPVQIFGPLVEVGRIVSFRVVLWRQHVPLGVLEQRGHGCADLRDQPGSDGGALLGGRGLLSGQ